MRPKPTLSSAVIMTTALLGSPALAADLGPLFAEVSMYALMAAVLAFRPAGLFSAKA
jgi:branched-subunit amino acid ABC-type transport system permease component